MDKVKFSLTHRLAHETGMKLEETGLIEKSYRVRNKDGKIAHCGPLGEIYSFLRGLEYAQYSEKST